MKLFFPLITLLLVSVSGNTQYEYSNQYLGWIKLIKATDPVKPAQYDHRRFTAKQLSYGNLFISWIQASYIPKGGLGEGRRTANEKLSPYNQYTRSLHPTYGAFLPTYLFLKKKPDGGWTPENNLGLFLRVAANGLAGDHIDIISSPDQYYFYIPQTEDADEYSRNNNQFMGFNTHPVLSRYIHYYQPKSIRYLSQYVVLLSKNNQLPWIQITKGEFLEQLGKAIERTHAENLRKINEDYNEIRKKTFRANEDELYKRRIKALTSQKEKYKNRLAEKATIYTEQPSVHLENTPDLFEGNGGSDMKIPVYKYDPARIALTHSDIPQWITISWGGGEMQDETFKNLHSSMLNNVNFDYIYNYFFDQEKNKNQPYKPVRVPVTSEKISLLNESAKSEKIKKEPGLIFFDDFSTTIPGKAPVNWNSTNNHLGQSVSTAQPLENGINWGVIRGNKMELRDKILLPENFSFSCTIAVPKGFTWGAKRLVIKFGTEKESFLVSMRPGFDGNPGFLNMGPDDFGSSILQKGSTSSVAEIPVPGFSNNNPFNQFQLQVIRNGLSLELMINNKLVFSNRQAFLTSGGNIKGIVFSHSRSDNENDKYYVSDIKVKND